MPKIFVFGATGYVGGNLARLLVQSGQHTVYGLARSEAKGTLLFEQEITPVICPDPALDPSPYIQAIRSLNIDIVVDVAGANQQSANFLDELKKIGAERLNGFIGGVRGPKLGFVYCSGTWVHGSNTKSVNDLDTVGPDTASPLVSWRVDLERSILASADILDIAIVRPALIYGRQSTIWTPFLRPLLEASRSNAVHQVEIPLDPKARPGLIHVDDVASGFVQVVERLQLLNSGSVYPVFDLVTSQENMSEIFTAAAAYWNYKGRITFAGPGDNLFARAMSTSMRGSSARAQQLLHWSPKRLNGFIRDMDIFAAAFAASMK